MRQDGGSGLHSLGPVKEMQRSVMGSSFDVSMPFPPSSCTKSPDSAQPGRDLCGEKDVDESAQDQLMHTVKIEHLSGHSSNQT